MARKTGQIEYKAVHVEEDFQLSGCASVEKASTPSLSVTTWKGTSFVCFFGPEVSCSDFSRSDGFLVPRVHTRKGSLPLARCVEPPVCRAASTAGTEPEFEGHLRFPMFAL